MIVHSVSFVCLILGRCDFFKCSFTWTCVDFYLCVNVCVCAKEIVALLFSLYCYFFYLVYGTRIFKKENKQQHHTDKLRTITVCQRILNTISLLIYFFVFHEIQNFTDKNEIAMKLNGMKDGNNDKS